MAWHGMAWHGMACHGTARHATAWHGMACHGTARHGMACTESGWATMPRPKCHAEYASMKQHRPPAQGRGQRALKAKGEAFEDCSPTDEPAVCGRPLTSPQCEDGTPSQSAERHRSGDML